MMHNDPKINGPSPPPGLEPGDVRARYPAIRAAVLRYRGHAAILVSAAAFAMNVALAGVAYAEGANIHALNLVRAVAFWLCLAVVLVVQNRSVALPGRATVLCLLLGVLLCIQMYVLLGAIQFIPVALAIVIVYTYPLMIAGHGWATGREPFSTRQLLIMLAVFTGLALAVSAPTGIISAAGVGLAVTSAVVLACILLVSERVLDHHDNNVVMFHMLSVTALMILTLSLTEVDLLWPSGGSGWLALIGSTACYVLATFLLFTAVHLIGPLQTAVIDNTSPVWAVVFGYLLLSQELSMTQFVGVMIVVLGVLYIQYLRLSERAARATLR